MARLARRAHYVSMTDSFDRIQEHLGTVLQRLSACEARAAKAGEKSRDVARCLGDLHQVADQLDRAFEVLKSERTRLRMVAADAESTSRRARRLFVESPSACLVVYRDGSAIAEANTAASRLLNVSQRHLVGKTFTNFLQQDRDAFQRQLQRASQNVSAQWRVELRPRERAMVQVLLTAVPDAVDTVAILLSPCDARSADTAVSAYGDDCNGPLSAST